MRKHNPNNERIKRDYFTYLERAKRMSPESVDQVAAAIAGFEESTSYKDFRKFHRNQAVSFLERLQRTVSKGTGRPLAKATVRSRLMAMKAFIQWLQGQPGFRSRITYDDAEYFNPSANDDRIATAVRERPVPTFEDIRRAVEAMPKGTQVQRRDRALVSAAILFGARDDALASLALKHVDVVARTVFQDARFVRTKNAKTFTSGYFPVDALFEEIVREWVEELASVGYVPDDPLFPTTAVEVGPERRFAVTGLTRKFWRNANAIRRIFKEAFTAAGLPYFNPHSVRKTLAIHGEKICHTPEEWKAYSQNFGHSSPMTTFNAYSPVAHHRQVEIMNDLVDRAAPSTGGGNDLSDEELSRVFDKLRRKLRSGT